MKYLLMGALLTWSSAANGEDEKPKFSNIKQGEVAPFDGRLFNDAAVSKIIVDNQFGNLECKLRVDFEIGQVRAAEQYKYDILYAKSEADNQRFTDVISIRDQHIQSLEKYVRPSNAHWWAIGGFTVGAGAAIGIMYAITPGLR
jgi:demethoxyubiquinone hydroxylase (CLK1/Coq7/Cat5 family)